MLLTSINFRPIKLWNLDEITSKIIRFASILKSCKKFQSWQVKLLNMVFIL